MKGITGNPALDAYHRMAISPVSAARPADRVESHSKDTPGNSAAEVKISARARELAVDANTRGIDTQKVEALKQRIADGTFRVDSQAIATRMIEQLG